MAGDATTPIPAGSDTDAAAGLDLTPAMPGREAAPEPPPEGFPARIAHYKVVREIGAGGMGHVLKCLDTTLSRYVALKILRSGLADNATFIERFRREAHAVAKLRHPNIVQIYSIGDDDDLTYFTMEYVDGEGLDRLLTRRKRLKEREVLQMMREVCAGLQEAHDSDILHRDIKPGNVLVNSDGRAQLSDFGLAKFVYQQTLRVSEEAHAAGAGKNDGSMTDPGRVMGTPYYMAPELIQGREADARSEVYALGTMMYELLAGQVPFKKESVDEIFDAHLGELPPPIAELNPAVSLETATICYRALEKEPSARYQSAEAMGEALQAALERERRAEEAQARAQLGAEMATAFGSARMSAGGGGISQYGPLITRLVIVALFLGLLWLVVEGLKMPDAGPDIPGSAMGDTAFAVGTDCRVAGIVAGVEEGAAFVRVALETPAEKRWIRLSRRRWDAMGATVPSPDTWWVAQGRVLRAEDHAPELETAERGLWPVSPFDRHQLETDGSDIRLIKLVRVKDWEGRHVGARVGVAGTVVWRTARGSEGPVRLLLARGEESARVIVPRPIAKQVRGMDKIRIGERVLVIGRLKEVDPGDDPLLEPGDEVTVEAPKELQRERRER
ncbi:MAG: serine/threonine-protein kinase [Planctomycetota bacterium]|jgi:predicted Ser/Thr protein kinase